MANMAVSVREETDATPVAVCAVLTDPAKMHLWVNGVQSANWDEGSSLHPGGRFSMKYRYARRVSDITMEVTVAEAGSRFEYHTVKGPYPIEAKFTLEPLAAGTAVTYSQNAISDSKLAALGFILTGWFAKRMVRRQLRKDIEKLGALAKSGTQAGSAMPASPQNG